MTTFSEIQLAHIYIYKKQEKCETFLYTKIQTLRINQYNLPCVLIYKKLDTSRYAIFHGILEIGGRGGIFILKNTALWIIFLYTKNTLCVTLLYAKILTLYMTFLYAQNNTLCVTFLYTKCLTLCIAFLYTKNDALCVTFLYTKNLTLCVTFLCSKNNALCVKFYI